MSKLLSILISLSVITTLCVPLAFAQSDASSSADSVTQTLKDRVQKVLKNEEAKVEGASTLSRTSFGLIGTIQKIVGSTLQIQTVTGQTRVVELDKTASILKAGKLIKNEDVELNSPVLATGVFDQDGTYHVRRLSALSDPYIQSKRVTIFGTIQTVTSKAFGIAVIAGASQGQLTLPSTTKTSYFDLLGTKIEKKFVKATQQVIAIVPDVLTASSSAARIYVMTPVSTVSATPAQ